MLGYTFYEGLGRVYSTGHISPEQYMITVSAQILIAGLARTLADKNSVVVA
jgi:hypothetical protein